MNFLKKWIKNIEHADRKEKQSEDKIALENLRNMCFEIIEERE